MKNGIVIGRKLSGRTVAEILHGQMHITPAKLKELLQQKRVRLAGRPCVSGAWRVRTGQKLEILPATEKARKPYPGPGKTARHQPLKGIVILHIDDQVIVVDKPAGLTTVRHADEVAEHGRGKRYLPPTLVDVLPALLPRGKKAGRIRAVHRLDRDTSGLVVLARTAEAERHLGLQFRAHSVERTYLALVRGRARTQTIVSSLVADRGDSRRGSGDASQGKHAITHVRVVEEVGDFTLVECRLETGRTHQVRIHLGEAGTPLCGERLYDRPRHGAPLPDHSGGQRPALHAATLAFVHPTTGQRLHWTSPLPKDLQTLIRRLRQ